MFLIIISIDSMVSFSVHFQFLLSIFQLGGGYLFGLPVGFVADSIGATVGAGAAFLLGRTVSSYGASWYVSSTDCRLSTSSLMSYWIISDSPRRPKKKLILQFKIQMKGCCQIDLASFFPAFRFMSCGVLFIIGIFFSFVWYVYLDSTH